MGVLGIILIVIGGIVALVGWVMVLIKAFQESALWGVGSLLVGPVWLVFAIMHFQDCRKGFFYWLGGLVLYLVGIGVAAAGADTSGLTPPQ